MHFPGSAIVCILFAMHVKHPHFMRCAVEYFGENKSSIYTKIKRKVKPDWCGTAMHACTFEVTCRKD